MSRAHDKLWNNFIEWCASRSLTPLPAHPWTISAYLRWKVEQKSDGNDLDTVLKGISRGHILRGKPSPHAHPMIEKTLQSISKKQEAAPDQSNLFNDKDFLEVTPLPMPPSEEEVEVDFASEEEDAPAVPAGLNRGFSMRANPKLSRKRREIK